MDEPEGLSFGEVLNHFRKRKRLSQEKLAMAVGAHRNSISLWERGEYLPETRAILEELARVLSLDKEETRLLLEARFGTASILPLHDFPFHRNPYFTGCEELLDHLHTQLKMTRQVALTQAIGGLGGIGKTQLALEYAYRYQDSYHNILWAGADSYETLIAAFVNLAMLLDVPEKNEQDQNRIVAGVQRWLSSHKGWLRVLDNIEDLELVKRFVPPGQQGAVLLTTRRQITEPVAQVIELESMVEEVGALFLLKRIKSLAPDASLDAAQASERQQARAISQMLGGLPLALDQAGAYILETGCALVDYLPLYEQRHADLLARRGNVPADHPESVATTFSLAVERIQQKNPAAVDLLRLCAFLAPDAIPESLITEGAAYLGPTLQPVVADLLAWNEVVEVLRTLSLIHRNSCKKMLGLHRLVQMVLQDEMSQAKRRTWVERCIRLLDHTFPSSEWIVRRRDWCEQLVPHVQTSAAFSTAWEISFREAASLFQNTAHYLLDRAQYEQAESLFQRALHIREQTQGPDHLDVADPLKSLATLYADQGKYSQAWPLFQRALHIWEQALGPDHPDVACSLHNLAVLYLLQDQYEQAESLFQQALHIWEQALGPDHPRVAYPLDGLADLYIEQGQYGQAEPLYQRALHIWEQALGPDHPNVAHPLRGLATLYQAQGQYLLAEWLLQRALTIREARYGLQHPDTAESLHDLAVFHHDQGHIAEAGRLYQQALTIREQLLGPGHPDLQATLTRYTALLRAAGLADDTAALEACLTEGKGERIASG